MDYLERLRKNYESIDKSMNNYFLPHGLDRNAVLLHFARNLIIIIAECETGRKSQNSHSAFYISGCEI